MKLAVTAETTIDLTPALLKEFDIEPFPWASPWRAKI